MVLKNWGAFSGPPSKLIEDKMTDVKAFSPLHASPNTTYVLVTKYVGFDLKIKSVFFSKNMTLYDSKVYVSFDL